MMNQEQLSGKLEQFQSDAKIWFGKTTGEAAAKFEGDKEKIAAFFAEHKGIAKEQADKEVAKFEASREAFKAKTEEVNEEIKAKFEKFNTEDLKKVNGSFEKFAEEIKVKYNTTQEEANAKLKELFAKFH